MSARGSGRTAREGLCFCLGTRFNIKTQKFFNPFCFFLFLDLCLEHPTVRTGPSSKMASEGKEEERTKDILRLNNSPNLYWRHSYCHVVKDVTAWTPTVISCCTTSTNSCTIGTDHCTTGTNSCTTGTSSTDRRYNVSCVYSVVS